MRAGHDRSRRDDLQVGCIRWPLQVTDGTNRSADSRPSVVIGHGPPLARELAPRTGGRDHRHSSLLRPLSYPQRGPCFRTHTVFTLEHFSDSEARP